ncbi:MAG: NRDE family protein [Verrucomicrobia subdivision 3 bacterium]|nr:NRDE family protein [Limisphaerales bacterium]
MNRDEKLTRATAMPPARHRLGSRHAIFPSEPTGGTWIGVNDALVTFALINWYSVPVRVTGQTVTRGDIVKLALLADSPRLVDQTLTQRPLNSFKPFRLIGVFFASHSVVEWRWNLNRLERLDHRWQTNNWISSGFDEPGAQQTRGETFRNALRQSSADSVDWLRRLHGSHSPGAGPYSICMHRDDAATVSYTEISVSRRTAIMRYRAGSPCCRSPDLSSVTKTLCCSAAAPKTVNRQSVSFRSR